MEIKGVWLSDFERIVDRVSRERYNGNLKVHENAHPLRVSRRDHLRGLGNTRARLSVKDSKRWGARTSVRGQHGRYASWEAHRDVLGALFEEYPDARVRTGLADYVGQAGFLETFPATAYHNIGSMVRPMTMPDLTVYPEAVDIQPITADESARWAALAAERLAENQQYREQWGERNPEPRGPAWYTENDADRGVHPMESDRAEVTAQAAHDVLRLNAENAANPGMIALREYVAAHPENWVAAESEAERQERAAAAWYAARRAERQQQYRDMLAENEAGRQERGVRRAARELAEDLEGERAVARAEGARHSGAESMIQEINDLLAEVAAEGWRNPYGDPDSPARKLA